MTTRTWLVALAVGSLTPLLARTSLADPTTQPAAVQNVTVAVLELEILADIPAANRKALAAVVDTLVTDSLTRQKGFVPVDRQALDRVLAERVAAAAGLSKIDAADVAPALRPFWSAGLLVCGQIGRDGKVLLLEAVSAQNGQLRASLLVPIDSMKFDATKIGEALTGKLASFWDQARQDLLADASAAGGVLNPFPQATANRGPRPLVEVSGGLASPRCQWMVDDLADAVRAALSTGSGWRVLVPRQPFSTKEERLLRVMGLAAAPPEAGKEPAGAASQPEQRPGLRVAPDVRVTCEMNDLAKAGVEWEKAPIRLGLTVQGPSARRATTSFDDQVGQWESCRAKAVTWASAELAKQGRGPGTGVAGIDAEEGRDVSRSRDLATREVGTIFQLKQSIWNIRQQQPASVRRMILDHALRAAHLDPTNPRAAYLIALYVDVLYDGAGYKDRPRACYDRIILECQRYLTRFPETASNGHQMRYDVAEWMQGAAAGATYGFSESEGDWYSTWAHYYRVSLRAEGQKLYIEGRINEPSTRFGSPLDRPRCYFGIRLFNFFRDIPDEWLEEEYRYWKEFCAHPVLKSEQSTGIYMVPWDMIEAAYFSRRKDVQATRQALQRLASICPKERREIWQQSAAFGSIVPALLNAAGDPQARTWQPDYTPEKTPPRIPPRDVDAFVAGLRPVFPPVFPKDNLPALPVCTLALPGDESPAAAGKLSVLSSTILLFVDDEVWLLSMAPGDADPDNGLKRKDCVALFRAAMPAAAAGRTVLDPTPLPWPKLPEAASRPDAVGPGGPGRGGTQVTLPEDIKATSCLVQSSPGQSTAWIGTMRGLVRFDRSKGGPWKGRWYTTLDGLPSEWVCRLGAARLNGQDVVIVGCWADAEHDRMSMSALNPATGATTLLSDGGKRTLRVGEKRPMATLRDGRVIFLEYIHRGVYGHVDLKDVAEFGSGAITNFTDGKKGQWQLACVTPRSGAASQPCMWVSDWADGAPLGYGEERTYLRPIYPEPGRKSESVFHPHWLSAFAVDSAEWSFREFCPVSGLTFLTDVPYFKIHSMVGVDDTLWIHMTDSNDRAGRGQIIGYQPTSGDAAHPITDRWIGPFTLGDPPGVRELQAAPGGRLLIMTDSGKLLVSSAEAIAAAEKAGQVRSSEEIRARIHQALDQAGWQAQVPALIMNDRLGQALAVLDEQEKRLSPASGPSQADELLRVRLWRGRVLAGLDPGSKRCIDLYRSVAEDATLAESAQAFGKINLIHLLYKAERYAEMLDTVDKYLAGSPKTFKITDELKGKVTVARRLLAPKTQPEDALTVARRESPKPPPLPTTLSTTAPDKELVLDLGNKVTIKVTLIPAGKFMMGSPPSEKGRRPDETLHEVTIGKPFYMGVYTVTQAQWVAIMGPPDIAPNKAIPQGDDYPQFFVDWQHANVFCKRLSAKIGIPVRLPTEAEWEYACRAGGTTRFSFGDDPDGKTLADYAWYAATLKGNLYPRPVGQKRPNAWGLYDMHGNVAEWCLDLYDKDYYAKSPPADPRGPDTGSQGPLPILRGGSALSTPEECRSAARRPAGDNQGDMNGLRVAVSLGPVLTAKFDTTVPQFEIAKINVKPSIVEQPCRASVVLRNLSAPIRQYQPQERPPSYGFKFSFYYGDEATPVFHGSGGWGGHNIWTNEDYEPTFNTRGTDLSRAGRYRLDVELYNGESKSVSFDVGETLGVFKIRD